MKKSIIAILLVTGIFIFFGCNKNSEQPSVTLLKSYLIDGPWKLVTANQYNGTGVIVSRTAGTLADSVIFATSPDANQNVVLTNLFSFIGGTKTSFSYGIKDSTLLISLNWKSGYSDTLFLINYSDDYLTFKVKKISDPSISFELDSLKKIRFY